MNKKDFEPYLENPPEKKTSWDTTIDKIRALPVNWYVIHHSESRASISTLVCRLRKKHLDFKFEMAPSNDGKYFKLYAYKIS